MPRRDSHLAWGVALVLCTLAWARGGAVAEEAPPAVPLEHTLQDPPATGLAVLAVTEGSQAARAGIEPGDVLLAYAGKATRMPADLQEALTHASAAGIESVTLDLVRWDGRTEQIEIGPGPIGVSLVPVEKGKGVPPLPPATNVTFDFARLDEARLDDWYTFSLGAGGKRGFEHATLERKGSRLIFRREVAFDGGDTWGVNHFDVRVTMSTEPRLRLLEVRFENPITGFVGRGTVEAQEDGTRQILFAWRNDKTDASGSHGGTLPEDLPEVPSYVVESLSSLMPREPGACFHFRPVVDGWGTLDPRSALLCVGKESVDVSGGKVETHRYEHRRLGGTTAGTYWVDEAGRVVKADYGGPIALLASKEDALADLHKAIRPRTAD